MARDVIMKQNLVIKPIQPVDRSANYGADEGDQPSPNHTARSPISNGTTECSTLRFKMISKHPDFPHNKLFSVSIDESLVQLEDKVSKITKLPHGEFCMFWEDADKYPFALNTSVDWQEALSYFAENKSSVNLKIYITAPKADRAWITGEKRPSFEQPARPAEGGAMVSEASATEDVLSPTSSVPSARGKPRLPPAPPVGPPPPVDEPIAEGCDSFETSCTATLLFNEDAVPASNTLTNSQYLAVSSPGFSQSFCQPLNNLSFCTVLERNPTNPTSPLCGPADANTGHRMVWKKGKVLGKGAYGTVYLGLNQNTGELLAVKQVCLDEEQTLTNKETAARLRALAQEIRMMENLQHPNIVRYLGTDRTTAPNGINIFMEYIPGGSIASLLKQFGPFQEELISAYLRQILLGLNYLHDQDVLHRDIKGANILVSQKGEIKLADFGSSKSLQDIVQSGSIKNTFVGTAEWMAPEAIRCKNQTKPADIWSLGCTVLEMTYADTPWSRTMQERCHGITALYKIAASNEVPRLPYDELSGEACDFLALCLRRDPCERPSTAELLQHPWLQFGSPVPSAPVTPCSPPVPLYAPPPRARVDVEAQPEFIPGRSGDSDGGSGDSEEGLAGPMIRVQDQERRILTYVASEVQRTLSLAGLPPAPAIPQSAPPSGGKTGKADFRGRKLSASVTAIQAPWSMRPESGESAPSRPFSEHENNNSFSSSSSPRRSPCSPLVNASFASSCSLGFMGDGRQGNVRNRRPRTSVRPADVPERNPDPRLMGGPGMLMEYEEPPSPLLVTFFRDERTVLLVLIVVLISVVLAAFAQGFCRSLAAETRLKDAAPATPLLCLPIYNVGPPFDYLSAARVLRVHRHQWRGPPVRPRRRNVGPPPPALLRGGGPAPFGAAT